MVGTSVKINSAPVAATDPLRYVPKEKWRDLMLARRHFAEVNVSYDCRCLVEFCDDAKVMHAELGFASPESMIRDGYGLEPEEVSLVLEWLKLNPPSEPIPLETAKSLALKAHGGDRKSEKAKAVQVGNTNLKSLSKGGLTATYTLARLDRDRPDLAEKVRSGELSANAAAVEAGFRRRPSFLTAARRQVLELSLEELYSLIDIANEEIVRRGFHFQTSARGG